MPRASRRAAPAHGYRLSSIDAPRGAGTLTAEGFRSSSRPSRRICSRLQRRVARRLPSSRVAEPTVRARRTGQAPSPSGRRRTPPGMTSTAIRPMAPAYSLSAPSISFQRPSPFSLDQLRLPGRLDRRGRTALRPCVVEPGAIWSAGVTGQLVRTPDRFERLCPGVPPPMAT